MMTAINIKMCQREAGEGELKWDKNGTSWHNMLPVIVPTHFV